MSLKMGGLQDYSLGKILKMPVKPHAHRISDYNSHNLFVFM